MSKHYYIESDRIVSKIGGGFENAPYDIFNHVYDSKIQSLSDYQNKSDSIFLSMMPQHFDSAYVYDDVVVDMISMKHIYGLSLIDEPEELIFWYHKDHLGSSTQITDGSATVIHHIEYMPSGEQFVEQRSTWGTSYKFNSKELDAETGLYYYGARYYTPEIGIWLSVDPLSDKYPHQSAFMFCSGNPVVRVDMDGLNDDIFIVINAKDETDYNTQLSNAKEFMNYMYNTPEGKSMIDQHIDNDKHDVYFTFGNLSGTENESEVETYGVTNNDIKRFVDNENSTTTVTSSSEAMSNFNGLIIDNKKKNSFIALEKDFYGVKTSNNKQAAKVAGHEMGAHVSGLGHDAWGQTYLNDPAVKNSPADKYNNSLFKLGRNSRNGSLNFTETEKYGKLKLTR